MIVGLICRVCMLSHAACCFMSPRQQKIVPTGTFSKRSHRNCDTAFFFACFEVPGCIVAAQQQMAGPTPPPGPAVRWPSRQAGRPVTPPLFVALLRGLRHTPLAVQLYRAGPPQPAPVCGGGGQAVFPALWSCVLGISVEIRA